MKSISAFTLHFKKLKVYHYFWITALLILTLGVYFHNLPDNTLDINIHDTYFVIEHLHVAILLTLFYFFNGIGYWFVEKILKKTF